MSKTKQDNPYTQVCVWQSTILKKGQEKEFEEFMLKEYKIRVKFIEVIYTFPDRDEHGNNVEGTGGRSDVFFYIHIDDITKFAIPRLKMEPPVRWIEDVLGNMSDPDNPEIYPQRVTEYRSWEAEN